jgi:EAL domain-containing protein (putative c-di-GMP-specific phosphodiesterase class I)
MKKLRARGIHLAMDDFGTGYSSLAYLKQFPLNTLKIDKAFIDDMNTARGRNMVDTIVTIAHNLSLNVVAEGVEQPEQLDMLRKLRCDVMQGYYYSKPLSGAQFQQFLLQQKQQRTKLIAVPAIL